MNRIDYEELDSSMKTDYLYSKGDFLIKSDKLEQAQEVLDVFWELDQYEPRYNLLVARLNFENGDLEKAIYYYRLSKWPTSWEIADQLEAELSFQNP
jgi:hypothetical protein